MTLAAGTRFGPYEILAPLGAGGMGEVYRAKDTKLGRDVAIKVLPESVSADPERLARFEREARALASLNHPNIVTVYSVEEAGNMRLLAMELVEGQTLDLAITTGGLPLSRFFEIAVPLADALSAAHERGIVHRDLKPANVMLTREGRLKVLDFGLAKLVAVDSDLDGTGMATASRAELTGEGTVFGTVAYMSPEQARGGKVDARSDVFSLGVVLYEMLTGDRPFKGASSVDIISSILRDWPSPVTELRADLPPHVGRILRRCLAKDPHDRYQTSRDVFNELRDLQAETSAASAAPPAPAGTPARGESGQVRADEGLRVAVVPFKSSGDAEMESFAAGLGEEITTGLSRFRYLSVVASASAARLKGEAGDERALGARLGARYVLEGSIRKGGSAVRVSAQLIDAQTGARLWAETYNRDLQASSIFAAQDDIAARIVATVADSYGVLVHSMRSAMRQKDDVHLTPVEWQFQYFAYREQITPSAYAELKSRLERAVERDGRQSDLWACLAQIFVDEYAFGFGTDPAALDRALASARRAVELDRANQFALVALAQTHFFRQDLAAFGPAAERAMALNPLNTDAVGILGLQIVHTGEFERGAAIVRRAMELNANHAGWMHFAPLWEHFHKEEYEQALERANRVDVPGLFWPYLVVASACGHLGRRAEAAAAVRDLVALDPEFAAHARSNVGTWHFASGLMEPILEGLRKAGLSIPATGGSSGSLERSGKVTVRADRAESATDSGAVRAEEGFWVAVLPFKYSGANAELTALAEGLSEEIVTGLSRFSYLRVIARSSTLRYANESVDVRAAGKELGARYVMEGSLRQAGTKLRLAVQLVDAVSGAHLWAENFERAFSPETVFELQDDLVPRIVSTVADMYGVLVRSMSEALRGKADEELSPHEAVLSAFGYMERVTPEEHARVRRILERAVRIAPNQSDAWAMLANLYWEEHAHGLNPQPDPLGRALAAARRAVESAPSNNLAHYALASTLFFQKDIPAFRSAAERAIELNRMDASVAAFLGNLIAYAGDWERGTAIVESAMQLNPHHPGWYSFVNFNDAYRRGDYRGALGSALKFNQPGNFYTHAVIAEAYGQLGMREESRKALQELLAIRPDFARTAREEFGRWFDDLAFIEHQLDGLRKAGLEIAPDEESAAFPAPGNIPHSETKTESGVARAEEGFRVAVLPFKFAGASAELKGLADGLSEEIVTGLSRFSYLRVIARGSTAKYSSESGDVRAIGKELGARYVMEGSLRQSGSRLRIAVQLVDGSSGAHLWAETFDRPFQPETLFELQDEIVPRIVSTVADMNGVLPRSMSEAVRSRNPEQLSPYEAVLRSFGYLQRVTPEDLAAARSGLELAVRKAPDYADAWAMLAFLCVQEYGQGFKLQADPLTSGSTAARRAVEAAPSNPLACFSLAQALFFQKEFESFRNAAERAVALNPMDGNSLAFLGELLTYAGDSERGLALAGRAKQLNPHHPGWYWYADFYDAYRRGDYRGALSFVLKSNLPGHWGMQAAMAATYGQLGERDAAAKALRELLKLRPDIAANVRTDFEKWWEPAYVESFLDGLRKAGLEVPGEKPAIHPGSDALRFSAADSGAVRADEGFWVAVLPFEYTGANAELTALAEGLTEDIVTGLSRFSYLRVIARSSTARYASESVDVRSAGRELGARYVMEGSLRQAGTKLRLAVQLVDSISGAHLWAENYERAFRAETVFELQDDLVPRIVSTVADAHGVLPHTISEGLRNKSSEELSPYEAVLRSFGYGYRITPEEHAVVRAGLERAVEEAPGNSDAWGMLSLLYGEEHSQGFNSRPDSLGRALHAAQRAADAAPSNALAFNALARAYFFRKEFPAFRTAAERAIELNPLNGPTLAGLGSMMAYAGDWEHGCALVERATQLNPRHPGWYWMALFMNAYRKGDYRGAIRIGLKINLPEFSGTHEAMAAAYGQLGERDAAGRAVRELLRLKPDYLARPREKLQKFVSPELVEHMMDGLRKAGLDVPAPAGADPASAPPDSVAIAVLPFSDLSPTKDQDYLCEGMAEEIMNALVRIDGIRVASRTSAFRAQQGGGDLAAIARALSVGHVLEGSVRTSGTRLRVTAQLTDVASGYQLWSERFDRDAADVFAVQDEIAAGVVDAVKARLAPGSRTVQPRPQVHNLEAYRLYLKGRHLRYTKNDHGGALSCFEQATAIDPSHGPSWVGLAEVSVLASSIGLKPSREAYAAAKAALQTAAGLQGESGEALYVEGVIAFGERRWKDCERLMARATQVEPGHVQARCWTASVLCLRGRTEEAVQVLERAREIDPLAPYPYAMTGLCLLQARRPEEADRFLDQALAFDGDNLLALWVSGAAKTAQGLFDQAIARLERAHTLSNRAAFIHGMLGWALAAAGRADDAKAVLAALRARSAPATTALPEAWMLAALGDREGVWQLLDRACDEQQLLVSFTGLPGFDRLRTDPRFGALRVRMGLPPAQPVPQTGLEAPALPRADSATGPDAAVAIAVLPFSDMSPAKDQEYLCEGMAEEIMNALVRIDGIRVASRTSAFRAQRGGGDVASIARALSVNHVLEGSVRTAGTRLRVTAQLTDVASGYQLWSERFDRDAADVFAVQDEIAAGVVEAVKVRLAPGARTVPSRPQVHNLEAYRSYLKGRHLRGVEDYGGAMGAFEEAVRLDPAHAPSWTGLAEITILSAHMGMIPPRAACTAARKALATAKELQGESAEGLHVEAFAAFLERRWDAMETSWRRALELQPDHVLALGSFAISLCARQRLDEALPLFERAREADPLASFPYMLAGWGLLVSGRPEEGLRHLEDALTFEKEDASAIAASCMANVALGRLEEAIAAGEHGVAVAHRAPFFLGVLGWALATADRKDEARKILEELRSRPPASPTAVSEAWLLGALGEIDDAFDVLARAEEEHQGLLCYTGVPGFDALRSDPRFGLLLGRLGLPPSPAS